MAQRVVVIGGGIVGCSAAALLAEAGASVTLVEATAVGAGASGRNSGTIQHPFDPSLLELHLETIAAYRSLAETDPEFAFPAEPAGVLLLTDDLAAASARASELADGFPDLTPKVLDAPAVRRLEPSLAPGWAAVRVETGYPVVPEAATQAHGRPGVAGGSRGPDRTRCAAMGGSRQLRGVAFDDGETLSADAVLVAGGPWTSEILELDPPWPPISRTWGVTVQIDLRAAPSPHTRGGSGPHHQCSEWPRRQPVQHGHRRRGGDRGLDLRRGPTGPRGVGTSTSRTWSGVCAGPGGHTHPRRPAVCPTAVG